MSFITHNFTDLEYFLSKDKIFYITKGYYHTKNSIFAYPVFWPDKNGERVHPRLGSYTKNISDFNEKIFKLHPEYHHKFIPSNIPLIPKSDIIGIFNPRDKIKIFLEQKHTTVWHDIFIYLTKNLFIPTQDIGIFGSYLIDLHQDKKNKHIKDIDFVIYGLDNFYKIKRNIENLLTHFGFKHISTEHIRYHIHKFGTLFDKDVNSFKKTLANKWSSIQIKPGLLNTLRFVYKAEEIPPNPIITGIESLIQIEGIVENDVGSNFMPRVFTIRADKKIYTVVTYFWAFQSCVKKEDYVLVTGNLHQGKKVISIDSSSHGIKILS